MKLADFVKAPKPDSQNRNPILRSKNSQNWVSVLGIRFWSLPETGQFRILWILEVKKLAKAKGSSCLNDLQDPSRRPSLTTITSTTTT
jgi:hypothetical protein